MTTVVRCVVAFVVAFAGLLAAPAHTPASAMLTTVISACASNDAIHDQPVEHVAPRSYGRFARPDGGTPLVGYTSDVPRLLAQVDKPSTTKGSGVQESVVFLSVLPDGQVAAKTVDNITDVCRANSFTADTLVLMADGTKKSIKDVKVGDKVMATDPHTGEIGPRKVVDLIRHGGLHTMVAVRLSDGATIDATDGHPFWVESRGEWIDGIDLHRGDVVITAAGERLTVESLVIGEQDLTAYNLTVEGLHTYFAGIDSVLVHNAGCTNITEAGLAHSFDRHAAQWFGGQPTKVGQMAEWQGLIERAAGSSKVVPWSSGGTLTNAHLARIDGKYFAAQFDRETGDLVAAFVPDSDQLGAMLRLLGH